MNSSATQRIRRLAFAFALALLAFTGPLWGADPFAWRPTNGGRVATLPPSPPGRTGFTLMPNASTGIAFTNRLTFEKSAANQNLLNGAGLAVGDYDGDGWCDVYFCNLGGSNALYRNLGNWRFADVTVSAGVALSELASTGATFANVNGDAQLDLLVTSCGGGNRLFLNQGQGRFQEVALPPGIVTRPGSTTMALADIDGDGDLDLYLANYGENSILRTGGTISTRTVNGQEVVVGRYRNRVKIVDGKMIELGEPDVLYLNDGQGHFTPVSWTDGQFLDEEGRPLSEAPWDEGLTALFHDLNGDGAPDLYVCNDFQTPDRIWINDGHGRFRALPSDAIRSTCNFAMCADVADLNRDGYDDVFVADMLSRYHELRMRQMDGSDRHLPTIGPSTERHQIRRNTLFLARGDGTYADIANYARVDASDWTWCAVWLDVDLDGYEDLLTGNGHAFDTQDLDAFERTRTMGRQTMAEKQQNLMLYPKLDTPNSIFRNRGNLTFEETGDAWGFASTQVTHSIALADLDNDGDLDLALNCLNAPPVLYRNDTTAARVAIRTKGLPPNRQGIGARVVVRGGAVPMQSQEMICGGHYLSGSDPLRVFAAGSSTNRLTIEVTWRSGRRSRIADAPANCIYEIDEAAALPPMPAAAAPGNATAASAVRTLDRSGSAQTLLFRELLPAPGPIHTGGPFNDFERQPLLHRNYSQLGPGVAWVDLDQDGHDDLVLGSGRGGALAVYRGDGRSGFAPWTNAPWNTPVSDDLTALAAWTPSAGKRALLVGQANYESAPQHPSALLCVTAQQPPETVASLPDSLGAVAVADVDGDGDLDVFAGGRIVAGRYPEAPRSTLFLNQNGKLVPAPGAQVALQSVGLVSDAVFSDLDSDGRPDLVLACEWGPVRIFHNDAGTLREITAACGLEAYTGWWSGVNVGDFDGDGRLDLVAANWGLNSSYYQPTPAAPLRLYYGDFDGNATMDLLEAWSDALTGRIVPRRDLLVTGAAMPGLRGRFATHAAYAKADVPSIIGPGFPQARELKAATLASTVFLNRSNRFVAVPLPPEAQFAPAFAVAVADFDGDGREDIFLSQNFFAMRVEEPRLDSGRGLWLQGQGDGQFRAVTASGIQIYGEQRGAAVGDFDEDGRPDLAVAQNGATTRIYRNQGGRPGLRVRLRGAPANPDGTGAQLRVLAGTVAGPVREVHAGGGYWSQDSAVPVLAIAESAASPLQLWIRWPGGRVATIPIPPSVREMEVRP